MCSLNGARAREAAKAAQSSVEHGVEAGIEAGIEASRPGLTSDGEDGDGDACTPAGLGKLSDEVERFLYVS